MSNRKMKLHELDHAILTYLAANEGQHNSVSIARELEEDCQDTAKRLFNLNKKQWVDKQRSEGKNTGKNVYQINATGRNILQKANEPDAPKKINHTLIRMANNKIDNADNKTNSDFIAATSTLPEKHWINEELIEENLGLLRQKLDKKWQIDDRELKVKVLYKLSDILDASIADVLNHIASDLERA